MVQTLMRLMEVGVDWVLYLLLALSVIVVALAIERAVYILRRRGRLKDLKALVVQFLEGKEEAAGKLRDSRSVPAAVVVGVMDCGHLSPEATQEFIDSTILEQRLRLERGLDFFATTGSNAPFIGLFGTVLGIVRAFRDLSIAETTGPQIVMAGISEALVATAVGLGVAIPALVLFNVFRGQVRTIMRNSEVLAKLVLCRRIEETVKSG